MVESSRQDTGQPVPELLGHRKVEIEEAWERSPLLGSVQVVINGKILNKTAVSLLVINPSTNNSE